MSEKEEMTPKKLLVIIVEIVLVVMIAMTLVGLVQMFVLSSMLIEGSSMAPTIPTDGNPRVYISKASQSIKRGDVIIAYIPEDIIATRDRWLADASMQASYASPMATYDDKEICPASRTKTLSDFIRNLPFVSQVRVQEEGAAAAHSAVEEGYHRVVKRVVAIPGDTVSFVDGILLINGEKDARSDLFTFGHVGVSPSGTNNYLYKLSDNEYFILGDNRANSKDSEDYGPIKLDWIYGKVVMLAVNGKINTDI